MKRIIFWGWMAFVCCILAGPIHSFASDGMETYVVVSDVMGNSSYAKSNGDGTLFQQQTLVSFDYDGKFSYSNGIGDFDNDGEFDFILARGSSSGVVYFFRKAGPDNSFVEEDIDTDYAGGNCPAGMAVADFNEDGHLDFIMTYYGSERSDLFNGDGNLAFEAIELNATAPFSSLGADAADFNGDGHADFVVFPYYSSDEFYINLGDGKGSFTTVKNKCFREFGYQDVSAADFNNDGFADLAATDEGIIDIYYGIGDGKFEYKYRIDDANINASPIDNYDFDGDGNQDLVLGGYGNYAKEIAVMLGNGNGQFGEPAVSGGASSELEAISTIAAPPSQRVETNKEPVAIIHFEDSDATVTREKANLVVTAGQDIYVDGLDSYDEDGKITSYRWDFGDGMDPDEATAYHVYDEATAYHVYYDTGSYTITLTVTDDKGATGSAQFTLNVDPISASMKIRPRKLKLKRKGKRRMDATVKLPEQCDATQVIIDAIEVIEDGSPQTIDLGKSKHGLVVKSSRKSAKRNKFRLKFDRQAVIDAISGPSDETVLGVRGKVLCNGGLVDFSAYDTIQTIEPVKKKKKHSKK